MQRQLQLTADGSHTISIPELNVTYHSHHGAIQESRHVFIGAGLIPAMQTFGNDPIRVLEIGFGTGLNALLTAIEAEQQQRSIQYITTEKYPVTGGEAAALNHGRLLHAEELFRQLHAAAWDTPVEISQWFSIQKLHVALPAKLDIASVHCIFLDAFAPDVQPELWSAVFFEELFCKLHTGGNLVTYSSKGDVRRALKAAGFTVTKIPGPPGKREMVCAIKS